MDNGLLGDESIACYVAVYGDEIPSEAALAFAAGYYFARGNGVRVADCSARADALGYSM